MENTTNIFSDTILFINSYMAFFYVVIGLFCTFKLVDFLRKYIRK